MLLDFDFTGSEVFSLLTVIGEVSGCKLNKSMILVVVLCLTKDSTEHHHVSRDPSISLQGRQAGLYTCTTYQQSSLSSMQGVCQIIHCSNRPYGIVPSSLLNPLSPSGVQHQYSPNTIHTLLRD